MTTNPHVKKTAIATRFRAYERPARRLLAACAALIVAVSAAVALQVAEPTIASANAPAMVKVPPIGWFAHRLHSVKKHRPEVCVFLMATGTHGASRTERCSIAHTRRTISV